MGTIGKKYEIQTLLSGYFTWLKDNTMTRQVQDWVEITVPFLDRHNDYLQVYVKQYNGGFVITDGGHTIRDLQLSGVDFRFESNRIGSNRIDSNRIELDRILNGFGVTLDDKELSVYASENSFAFKVHNLIQAMLAINYLYVLPESKNSKTA